MINVIYLIGRLVRDVECRTTESGKKVATFTLAVGREYKNAEGSYDTDYFNCVTYAMMAESMSKYTKKGDLIAIRGRLQNRKYEKDGETKYITEIIVDRESILVSKPKEEIKKEVEEFEQTGNIKQEEIVIDDDDLPF